MTFVIPMVLFIIVALGLYILYTKPTIVPGRRRPKDDHPVTYTAIPGRPVAAPISDNPAGTPRNSAIAPGNPGTAPGNETSGSAQATDVRMKADEGEKAETGDGE